jgi:two-component system NtrC family sensor kinase
MSLPIHSFLQLLDNTPSPVFMLNLDGVITYANGASKEMFKDRHLGVGEPAQNIIDRAELLQLFDSQENHGEVFLPDLEQTFNVELTRVPNVGTLVMMQDISHLRSAEQKQLGVVSEISQNLRSPLTAIIGYSELLDRIGDLNEHQRNFVDKIILSIRSMTQLINDLSELEKTQGQADTAQQVVDLRQIVRYAVDGLHDAFEEKSLNLQIRLANAVPNVKGNPMRLRQAVHNLLDNAIQYTPEDGQVIVTVEAEADIVMLSVQDSGIGIAPEDQPHIFDRFYRSDTALRMGTSSGLGLSIVRNIVKQHNGRIWVNSQVGEGSRFVMALPAHEPQSQEASV